MFTKLKVVGLDHTITNPQLANEIVKISNEWKHLSLRSCIYTGTHQPFPTRVLAQLSRL